MPSQSSSIDRDGERGVLKQGESLSDLLTNGIQRFEDAVRAVLFPKLVPQDLNRIQLRRIRRQRNKGHILRNRKIFGVGFDL